MKKSKKSEIDFYALTPAERRVAVARDALERIDSGMLEPTVGTYFVLSEVVPSGDMRDGLRQVEPTCHACVLGGLFLSQVMLGNGVTLLGRREFLTGYELKEKLR